jgi:hypothetical protein
LDLCFERFSIDDSPLAAVRFRASHGSVKIFVFAGFILVHGLGLLGVLYFIHHFLSLCVH